MCVEGIDHWVWKTAFAQKDPQHPIYTKDNYVPGLDSWYLVHQYGKDVASKKASTAKANALAAASKALHGEFETWKDLSMNCDKLSEVFLEKYADYIDWYTYLGNHAGQEFSKKFTKKFKSRLAIKKVFDNE